MKGVGFGDMKAPTGVATSFHRDDQEMDDLSAQPETWVAVDPVPVGLISPTPTNPASPDPPTFDQAQFDIVLRRQRVRPLGSDSRKIPISPIHGLWDFEFAGWGSMSRIKLSKDDHEAGDRALNTTRRAQVLGQFTASALAGNAVLGSVFYALPPVVAIASVYSPISLFIATLTLFLWRPILGELVDALPLNGAPYTWILNISSKKFASVAAVIMLLDYTATSVVSAATAASYLAGETTLPFPAFVCATLFFVALTLISLSGIKESAKLALVILTLHMGAMVMLIIASAIEWGHAGNEQLKGNWEVGKAETTSSAARQVFNGFCLGILGLTGFESAPAYVSRIQPGKFQPAMRNLHIAAIMLNVGLMLELLALVPLETLTSGNNVLSILAEVAAGKWLRTIVVVDAIIVLCGGVLTGILSACEMLEQLSRDRLLPSLFQMPMPITGSFHWSIACFTVFCAIFYATTAANLVILSQIFSLTWLLAMSLFPLSLLLLNYSRGRLLRRPRKVPVLVIVLTIAVVIVIIGGNIAIDPTTAGYFAAYFVVVMVLFAAAQNKVPICRCIYWVFNEYPRLHASKVTRLLSTCLVGLMTSMKRRPVVILVKSDEIHHLMHMVMYVRRNEETSCLKMVHFAEEDIPLELEANAKILDEAFPELTIDLCIIQAPFEPANVAALAHRLHTPTSLMFMSCPGHSSRFSVADFGVRIISL